MNLAAVQPIVDAVLYEGYILYPYRATATKNRQRWTFGGIYPREYAAASGDSEPCRMQTECLVVGNGETRLDVHVRFLQPLAREVGRLPAPVRNWHDALAFEVVAALTVDGREYHSWQEAVERDVDIATCTLRELDAAPRAIEFSFPAQCRRTPLHTADGSVAGLVQRRQAELHGNVALRAKHLGGDAWRVTVRIENETRIGSTDLPGRGEASLYSFASTHTVLAADGGRFVSQMDPPGALAGAAGDCANRGSYPVLVGSRDDCNMMLASPIVLYDFPEVAPESPGDLFDGTEIDEILSLNILAMTDGEKREMAATDPRAAALLARTEALNGDDFMRMHGVLRQPRPAAALPPTLPGAAGTLEPGARRPALAYYRNGGTELKVGDRVRLRPGGGADVMDLVLHGKSAVIEAIEQDFEDRVHVAVTVDDDPGRAWGLQRMPGHRFFFSPEEIEALDGHPRRGASL